MAAAAVMLETTDIQGLVVRGYGKLDQAVFLLLTVRDGQAEAARAYVRSICGRVNPASVSPREHAIQVAFTAAGLRALGVNESALGTFSREFLEGMNHEVRAVSLGDPRPLRWTEQAVHVLLMIYGKGSLPELEDELAGAFEVVAKETRTLPENKEHFGWRDGLSMPKFVGVPGEHPGKQQETWTDPLEAGEVVLGYENEYGAFSESPTADPSDDPADHLPPTADGARKDLGRNGTYLVYRELTQDVHGLWRHLAEQSREPGTTTVDRAVALGAKMVGRWPEGAPLVDSPHLDDLRFQNANTFTYAADPSGLKCPVGSHIRRANPRDALGAGRDADDSVEMVRKHQMVRRGRPFGEPVAKSMDPREIIAAKPDDKPRGLHFICLVGNISRQFEFVQRNWIQSANFGGLFRDADPLTATRVTTGDNPNHDFTCPASPVRRKYKGLPQFTTLVGGGYFFLPSLRALKFIARHP